MKICHVCQFECRDDAELCPLCGADMMKNTETEEIIEETTIKNPVLLATMEDVVSAEIFKDILIDNKIPFSSSEGDTGGLRVLFGGAIIGEEIYVDEKDFSKANELYEEFLNSEEIFFEENLFDDIQEDN